VFCITTNEANVILLFVLTEDAPIRGDTRLRLSHNEVIKVVGTIAYLTMSMRVNYRGHITTNIFYNK
jgi:hypothetical protein